MNLTDHNCFWMLPCLAYVIFNSRSNFDCWWNCPGLHVCNPGHDRLISCSNRFVHSNNKRMKFRKYVKWSSHFGRRMKKMYARGKHKWERKIQNGENQNCEICPIPSADSAEHVFVTSASRLGSLLTLRDARWASPDEHAKQPRSCGVNQSTCLERTVVGRFLSSLLILTGTNIAWCCSYIAREGEAYAPLTTVAQNYPMKNRKS